MSVHCFVHGGRAITSCGDLISLVGICVSCYTEYFHPLQESLEECARYLETIKIYENKPADVIQERIDHDYLSRVMQNLYVVHISYPYYSLRSSTVHVGFCALLQLHGHKILCVLYMCNTYVKYFKSILPLF
jgi:hypothetical protein